MQYRLLFHEVSISFSYVQKGLKRFVSRWCQGLCDGNICGRQGMGEWMWARANRLDVLWISAPLLSHHRPNVEGARRAAGRNRLSHGYPGANLFRRRSPFLADPCTLISPGLGLWTLPRIAVVTAALLPPPPPSPSPLSLVAVDNYPASSTTPPPLPQSCTRLTLRDHHSSKAFHFILFFLSEFILWTCVQCCHGTVLCLLSTGIAPVASAWYSLFPDQFCGNNSVRPPWRARQPVVLGVPEHFHLVPRDELHCDGLLICFVVAVKTSVGGFSIWQTTHLTNLD